jgi:branched-chain amino acid aminotransferase
MDERERIAYFNGSFVPESQVLVPFRDASVRYGEGVYDTSRTFGGRVFKLREHLERLQQSLAYVRIDPGLTIDELEEISLEVAGRNYETLGEDFWISQRITAGVPATLGGGEPTVIVESTPLPLAARARFYVEGVALRSATIRRTPPWAQSPQAKTTSLLNLRLADLEVRSADPEAWPLLCDENGNLAEAWGSNVFVVRDGVVLTPRTQYVLAGITRNTVIELARSSGLEVRETDVGLYEATTADELFLTSTSFCVCPVGSFNGVPPRSREIPGPITRDLQQAFAELVDFDFVGQYLEHLPGAVAESRR